MPALIDLSGQKFGQLTVTKQSRRDKWGQVMWECLCSCGNTVVVTSGNLRREHGNVSCGCAKIRIGKDSEKHGHTKDRSPSREYLSWQGMKKRCLDQTHDAYHNYGGRGITVCNRWLNSFENFISDLGERPPGTSLDRIDPYGNYEPTNCRWASWKIQGRNKRARVPLCRAVEG